MTTIEEYISFLKVKELKGLCKKHKIKRYSRLVKKELVDIIYDKYIELYDIQKLKKYNTIYENINFAFNDLHSTINTTLVVQDEKINYYRDTYDIEDAIISYIDYYRNKIWHDNRNMDAIFMNNNLTYDILVKYKDSFVEMPGGSWWFWRKISKYYSYLSIDFIEEFKDNIQFRWLSENHNLTDEIIIKYKDEFCWTEVTTPESLSLELIEKYMNNIDNMNMKTKIQKIKNNFIRKLKKYMTIDTYIRADIDRNAIMGYDENDVLCCDNVDKYKDVLNWNKLILVRHVPYNIFSYIINNYIDKLPIDIVIGNKRFKEYCSNVNYHNSYAYKRQQQRKQMEIIEEELIETAWSPNRMFDWCLCEEEKSRIKNNFTN